MALDTRLFIGNLPETVDENALRQEFGPFGIITNLDLKIKTTAEANNTKRFAFVTLCATHHEIESCIKYFSSQNFNGSKLYVTRARESFLERLQRERQEAALKDVAKSLGQKPLKNHPVLKLDDKLNPRKRQLSNSDKSNDVNNHKIKHYETVPAKSKPPNDTPSKSLDKSPKKLVQSVAGPENHKKLASDRKRLESMKMKREEFKQKKMIINTGLSGIDKVSRKKVIFSDSEDTVPVVPTNSENNANIGHSLFDNDDDSDDNVNFSIKEHYEGKKGQKVLELQSRYKSDKRFMLDERFVDDDDGPVGKGSAAEDDENVDLGQTDEKAKQLHILQDVLGIPIKSSVSRNEATNDKKKNKPKLGMLRFDPMQPDHVKFLAHVEETKPEMGKKNKKKKTKEEEQQPQLVQQEGPKMEVSKETYYKVSDALKEAIVQPNTFSLRSLFNRADDDGDESKKDDKVQEADFISLKKPKEPKVRNPLDRGEVNPFKYDSSDSETEEEINKTDENIAKTEAKAVWNEKFFFTESDSRLAEGIAFFTLPNDDKSQKDRRELKSLMKKRLHNRERKDQMFKKKIGGRRKSNKKSYRKKN